MKVAVGRFVSTLALTFVIIASQPAFAAGTLQDDKPTTPPPQAGTTPQPPQKAEAVANRFSNAAVFGVASSRNSQAMAMEQSTTNAALIGGPP